MCAPVFACWWGLCRWFSAQVQIAKALAGCLPDRRADRLVGWHKDGWAGSHGHISRLPFLPPVPSPRGPTSYTPASVPQCLCLYEPWLKVTTGRGFQKAEPRPWVYDDDPGGKLEVTSWYDETPSPHLRGKPLLVNGGIPHV